MAARTRALEALETAGIDDELLEYAAAQRMTGYIVGSVASN